MSTASTNLFRPRNNNFQPQNNHRWQQHAEYDHAPNVVSALGLVCECCHKPMSVIAPRSQTATGIPVTIIVCKDRWCPNNVREGWAFHIPTRQFKRIFPA